jgi:hypothetical protein
MYPINYVVCSLEDDVRRRIVEKRTVETLAQLCCFSDVVRLIYTNSGHVFLEKLQRILEFRQGADGV